VWRTTFPSGRCVIDVLARGTWAVVDNDRVSPVRSLLPGLTTVIAQEDQLVSASYLDLPIQQISVDRLAEALSGSRPRVAALRGKHLWIPDYHTPESLFSSIPTGRKTWVILGGLGRLGRAIAEQLASRYGSTIVLAGRTGVVVVSADPGPTSDLSDRVTQVDITKSEQIAGLLDAVETTFGRADFVVHAAGVTGEAATVTAGQMHWTAAEATLAPKVAGVAALAEALRHRSFERCVLFSSSSAVLGGLGLGAYAAANAYLDAYASMKHDDGDARWLSIGWDAWSGSVTPTAGFHHPEIPPSMAIDALVQLAGTRAVSNALVVNASFDQRLTAWAPGPVLGDRQVPSPADVTDTPMPDVMAKLANIWTEVLGRTNIRPSDRFRDLGGDSLAATRVAARIRQIFKVDLPLRSVIKAQTLDDLAALLDEDAEGQR
jgi:acyl carrier protein